MNIDSSPCVQKMLKDLLKSLYKIIIGEIILSLAIGVFFLNISTDLSISILSSLNDVFIALFGFVGLILVFIFGNLLTTKEQLEKEMFETNLKDIEFELASPSISREFTVPPLQRVAVKRELLKSDDMIMKARGECEKRLKEIDNKLVQSKKSIDKASFLGTMAIGSAVTCILINIWAFGAVTDKGLHFSIITLLVFLLFLCIDFISLGIRTVIK